MPDVQQAWQVLHGAELICTEAQIQQALKRLAGEITSELQETFPLVLSVMGGAVVFTGQLLPLLKFPLDFDYLHVTRYRGGTRGGEVQWKVGPHSDIRKRLVLILDDVLDEGETLAAIREKLLAGGAGQVKTAVFVDKALGRKKPIEADFVGLSLPNRYLFGFGMDINEAWRNLPAIYANKD
ncbi:MAG: hypoxanthine-guanine phosphoribosyltransferase [Burkholderiales bacterium]